MSWIPSEIPQGSAMGSFRGSPRESFRGCPSGSFPGVLQRMLQGILRGISQGNPWEIREGISQGIPMGITQKSLRIPSGIHRWIPCEIPVESSKGASRDLVGGLVGTNRRFGESLGDLWGPFGNPCRFLGGLAEPLGGLGTLV